MSAQAKRASSRGRRRDGRRGRRSAAQRWSRTFLTATALCLFAYAANLILGEVSPSSAWGLTYGTAAAILMIAAGLYGMRRRAMSVVSKMRLGSARSWLYVHLYGGMLFLLLMFMHSGFQLPSGTVTWWLWGLSIWTAVSGLAGLALQQWIPRTLGSGTGLEVLYERIPELVEELQSKAKALADRAPEPVRALYARRVAPELEAPRRRLIYFLDITGGKQAVFKEFDYLRRFLSAEETEALEEMARLYQAKLDVDAHYTLQSALRGWLWLHVPTSLVLFVFLILHLAAVYLY